MVSGPHGLTLDDRPIGDLVAEFGSPLHIVDMNDLDRNADEALSPFRLGRGADVFSSYKTNPIPGVLGRLHDAGIGAEAISEYELWLALELGVEPERILYNGPAKSFESLCTAAAKGVALVNANSSGDLRQIIAASAQVGKVTRVGLRISLPHMWGGQFGYPADSDDIAISVAEAERSPHVDLVGLHFHSGIGLSDHDATRNHLEKLLEFCDQLRDDTGFHPEVLDLGGSLTVPTVVAPVAPGPVAQLANRLRRRHTAVHEPQPSEIVTIAQASTLAWRLSDLHFGSHGLPVPLLMLEPGRSLTGDTQFMLTTVLDVDDVSSGAAPESTDERTVVLDAGVELAEPMRGGGHELINTTRPDATLCRHRLVGPRADDGDVLVSGALLPRLEPGDVLAVMDTGAYFVPFSTASTFPRPAVVAIDDGDVSLLRAREGVDRFSHLDPA